MVGTGFDGSGPMDGYAEKTVRPSNNTKPISIYFNPPEKEIEEVVLQLFVDDFQAPKLGSSFQVSLNRKRIPYLEELINSLDLENSTGQMITISLFPEDFAVLKDGKLAVLIDDPRTGVGDGFAIDFAQLLINPKGDFPCTGTISGIVKDQFGEAVAGALVSSTGLVHTLTDATGSFKLEAIPAGLASISVQRSGYNTESRMVRLAKDEMHDLEINMHALRESRDYITALLEKRGTVNLYGILFDTDSDLPRAESILTLQSLLEVLNEKPELSVTIVGHTDSEGSPDYNLDLSLQRALSIKA